MGESEPSSEVYVEDSLEGLIVLYDLEVGNVYNFVLRRCGADIALAEDITQETFLTAARHFRLTADVPNSAWLYQVARRRLVDHWRSEARRDRKFRLISGGRPDANTSFDPAAEIVSDYQIQQALSDLPAFQQAAFVLRYLDGYSTADVAETIGRSLKATESLLARARQNLASTYPEQGHD